MSEKNREAKRSARERLQQERVADRAREKRRRTLIMAATVAGVLGMVGVVGVIAANVKKDREMEAAGAASAPSGVNGKDDLAIPVGATDAPSTLTVYEDFRCPACAQFENGFRRVIHELERSGELKVEYHLATIIDGNMGGTGSLRAANAAACAQDAGRFAPYHDVLYANQPLETDDAFARNDKLLELAGKVPGLESAPGFRACVEKGGHDQWVDKAAEAFRTGGFSGTPAVLLNGETVFPKKGSEDITPENLKKWVKEANKGKKPGTATPTAPASIPAGAPERDRRGPDEAPASESASDASDDPGAQEPAAHSSTVPEARPGERPAA
ncbi:thioredoxin domain-containing protein [Streptomyces sp. NPDC088124]|uniref:DsbA family protein n=1 Tax=Streptomyces sp. NPDC088124 TaxID=3154654 RepID=UPI0034291D93